MSPEPPQIELRGISKRFGRATALDAVSLAVAPGEILGLLGENGAGKTTLMNVLFGIVTLDSGELRIGGSAVRIRSARDARELGVGMVHQHFTLVDDLTVAENLALEDGGRGWLWFDRRRIVERLRGLAEELGIEVDPDARVGDLSVGDRQRVEILKALKNPNGRVLVLDEPTATLTPDESDELFAVMRRLRTAGRAIIFISHKLPEVLAVTDRVVVLRAGQVVGERPTAETDARELGAMMVGPSPPGVTGSPGAPPAGDHRVDEPVVAGGEVGYLEVGSLVVAATGRGGRPSVDGVDLRVGAGEIVGVAGVDGNGQTELMQALYGLVRPVSGSIAIGGQLRPNFTARQAIAAGVAFVASDRHRFGIVPGLSLTDNLLLKHRDRAELGGRWLDRAAVARFSSELLDAFGVRPGEPDGDVADLSGGNQQRLVLARELAFGPRLILAESPTRGLDVSATRFVHQRLREAAAGGAAVLLVTTDLDEVLELSHRVSVMYRGRLHPCPSRERAEVGRLMAGGA